MKKIICLSLIAGIVLASCSTGKNGVFTKRKYTKGIFVESKGRATTPKEHEIARVKGLKPEGAVEKVTVGSVSVQNEQAQVLTANAGNSEHHFAASNSKPVSFVKTEKRQETSRAENVTIKNVIAVKKAIKNAKKADPSKGSDVNIIILIILCLFPFINLIPVYIKDGKITLNFWVTLILDLLFFLPGVIFALLRVLDIVNLA